VKPILLDLFCGAGGAAAGYAKAGFEVVGVDNVPQPHYPYEFIQADWEEPLWVLPGMWEREGRPYAIHASPPCQAYSTMTAKWGRQDEHPDLIEPVREHLMDIGCPIVIENVPTAPLAELTMLCGTMFGLGTQHAGTWWQLRRHRYFETRGFHLWPPASCGHVGKRVVAVYGHSGGTSKRDGISFTGVAGWRDAMGIDWMTADELAEAIPPAYTEWVGGQLIRAVEENWPW